MTRKITIVAIVIAGWPTAAAAYIDPGIVSTLVQALFAAGLGAVSMWIIRPWEYLRSAFRRSGRRRRPESPSQPSEERG